MFNILIFLFTFQIALTMLLSHPHQNVYFNLIAGKKIDKYFEMDYWGLSNKQAFEYILKNDNKEKIFIGSASSISLEHSKQILSEKNKSRIKISKNDNADYIIDNYINWNGKYKKSQYLIPNNFEIYKEIIVNNMRILSIYKKNETL